MNTINEISYKEVFGELKLQQDIRNSWADTINSIVKHEVCHIEVNEYLNIIEEES